MYRNDDLLGTTWTEVNPAGSFVRNDPYTRSFTVTTFPGTAVVGDVYLFKIRAFNMQGYVDSSISSPMVLASVPGTPINGPLSDTSVTNGYQIKVTYDTVSDNGGSTILSYELQMGS